MSEKCEACGQNLPNYYDLSEVEIVKKVLSEYKIEASGRWHRGSGWEQLSDIDVGDSVYIERLGTVEMIDKILGAYDSDTYTQNTYMIFKITQSDYDETVKHYKKAGEFTSFDGHEWNGVFKEVSGVPKTVTVWE